MCFRNHVENLSLSSLYHVVHHCNSNTCMITWSQTETGDHPANNYVQPCLQGSWFEFKWTKLYTRDQHNCHLRPPATGRPQAATSVIPAEFPRSRKREPVTGAWAKAVAFRVSLGIVVGCIFAWTSDRARGSHNGMHHAGVCIFHYGISRSPNWSL